MILWWYAIFAHYIPPWKNPQIHNFGNHGLGGSIHSIVAPFATYTIDKIAYDGYDVRQVLRSDKISNSVDLGCGVGFSTNKNGIGVDSSREMLRVAKILKPDVTFVRGLAERWGKTSSYDRVTISFLLHEQPQNKRSFSS
jgi:SAM-dependent methyltransferase